MKVQKSIEVWLAKKRLPRQIDLVQYDTGVQLVFTVQDFTIPSGTTATLYVQKPSGKFVYQETGITISGNTITVDLNNQAITEHGSVGYQVQLKNGNDTVTTFAGIFRVEKSLKDSGATESRTVLAAFEAKTAEQIAAIEAAAQAQIATIQNLYNTYATKNEAANAIKGNLSGTVVFADDVSPVEHNPVVLVHGKNLAKFNNSLNTDKSNFTYSQENASGIICTKNSTVGGNFFACYEAYLKAYTMYSVSFVYNRSKLAMFVYTDKIWGNQCLSMDISNNAGQFYVKEDGYHVIGFYISGDISGNISLSNVQIEKGNAATDYEAYIDPSTVTAKRCGKNLLKNTAVTQTTDGITFTVNSDGSVVCNGTSTQYVFLTIPVYLKTGKYILSGCPSGGTAETYSNIFNAGDDVFYYDTGNGVACEIAEDGVYDVYLCRFCPGVTASNLTFKPMLRLASVTDAAFEAYNGTEHAVSVDGTVPDITSLSPNMTILTDTDGAVVECEYIRDTNKVIEKLSKAIIALGGTV